MDNNNIPLIIDFYVNLYNKPHSKERDKLIPILKSLIQDHVNTNFDSSAQVEVHGYEFSIKVSNKHNNIGKRKIYVLK